MLINGNYQQQQQPQQQTNVFGFQQMQQQNPFMVQNANFASQFGNNPYINLSQVQGNPFMGQQYAVLQQNPYQAQMSQLQMQQYLAQQSMYLQQQQQQQQGKQNQMNQYPKNFK